MTKILKECFIPIALLREKFGPALENCPFVLSSSRGQLVVSDWRVLLWPAQKFFLTEVVLDVFITENTIENWNEGIFLLHYSFKKK